MSATLDLILERRRVRRRLAFWRILAIVAIVIAAVALFPRASGPITGDHIARIRVDGVISDSPKRDEMLAKIAKSQRVKALIVDINSPGGTVVGSEALYVGIRRIAKRIPVVAVMSEAAASGGYVTAISADHIVARGNTLTGSIGVLTEVPNVAGLMEKLGVAVTKVKSAPLKAEPSFTDKPTPEVIAAQRSLIEDSFAWFKGLVSKRRGLTGDALDKVTDGRVFTGRQALANGLIDEIGDEEQARDWLAKERGISKTMQVIDYDPNASDLPWPLSDVKQSMQALMSPQGLIDRGPRLYALIQ